MGPQRQALGQRPAEFGLEREDHIKRVPGLIVPDPVIAVSGVITGVVVIELVLYRFENAYAFFTYANLKVSFVDCCVVCFLSRVLFLAPKDVSPTDLPPQSVQNILSILSRTTSKNYKLRGN